MPILTHQPSLQKLAKVHPHLQEIVLRAALLSPVEFIVTEGMRTKERQEQLVAAGASKTMRSRHLTGHAVDLAPLVNGKVRWDWPLFYQLAPAVKQAAIDLGHSIEWGGDWKSFKDGPHFQLARSEYPDAVQVT